MGRMTARSGSPNHRSRRLADGRLAVISSATQQRTTPSQHTAKSKGHSTTQHVPTPSFLLCSHKFLSLFQCSHGSSSVLALALLSAAAEGAEAEAAEEAEEVVAVVEVDDAEAAAEDRSSASDGPRALEPAGTGTQNCRYELPNRL